MPRFFVDPDSVHGDEIIVTAGDYNHIRNVLRMHIGEPITVCDGQGSDYDCVIDSYGDGECVLAIREKKDSTVELPVEITLYQGLPKKDKMELIIQKAVELGAVRIMPVLCERTIVKLEDPKKEQRKMERFRAIAESAAKQSGRGILPEIADPRSFKDAVRDAKERGCVVLVPYENAMGMKATREAVEEGLSAGKIAVFIGPEGGFAREEIALAEAEGARIISLGRRILRTETAGLAVLSLLMLQAEEQNEQ
ncbi:MAG: 16S rRNA (uracil(1498)-N(3))-methyltransferase [Lachnospiraceae bacterium]|nr:16S rRNA (uracil(1498)-N(3))-methyltransferase [Lachnospiraceae bacterium]